MIAVEIVIDAIPNILRTMHEFQETVFSNFIQNLFYVMYPEVSFEFRNTWPDPLKGTEHKTKHKLWLTQMHLLPIYCVWLFPMVVWMKVQSKFVMMYCDLILLVFGSALTAQFKTFKDSLHQTHEVFWRTKRESSITTLTSANSPKINPLFFFS